jgi:hypothetical protein
LVSNVYDAFVMAIILFSKIYIWWSLLASPKKEKTASWKTFTLNILPEALVMVWFSVKIVIVPDATPAQATARPESPLSHQTATNSFSCTLQTRASARLVPTTAHFSSSTSVLQALCTRLSLRVLSSSN